MQTTFQNDGTRKLRQNPSVIGAECYEVRLVIALEMGKLATIESLRHGSFMWGQPPSAARRSKAPQS